MINFFSPVKERTLQFIAQAGISKELFYEITNIAASNFKGKGLASELGGEKIVKILTSFPDLSPEWLLMGTGNMLKHKTSPHKMEDGEASLKTDARVAQLEQQLQSMDLSLKQMIHTQKLMHAQYLEMQGLLRLPNPLSDKTPDPEVAAKKGKQLTGNPDELEPLRKRTQSN